ILVAQEDELLAKTVEQEGSDLITMRAAGGKGRLGKCEPGMRGKRLMGNRRLFSAAWRPRREQPRPGGHAEGDLHGVRVSGFYVAIALFLKLDDSDHTRRHDGRLRHDRDWMTFVRFHGLLGVVTG